MDDIRSGKVKAALFLFFIVLLIVGGYIGMILMTRNTDKKDNDTEVASNIKEEEKDIRIDSSKEYIYLENEVVKNEIREIIYQDVVINFDSNDARTIQNFLNNERVNNEKTYKNISEVELTDEEKENILFNESDVYEATYNKYTRYFYKNYATIVNSVYEYTSVNGNKNIAVSAYTFDIRNGNLLTKSKLMEDFGISLDEIKEKVKEKAEKEQNTLGEIDVSNTIRILDDDSSYTLYVNKSGYLVLNYLIKGMQEDKLDVIILN